MLSSLVFLVGALVIASQVFRFLEFLWFYLLKPSSVQKYLHGPAPYAIVTGASDGIGKAVAHELFAKGFNLIIHGRNEDKVRKVVDELKTRRSGDVRYFIADAAKGGHDFTQLIKPFADLNVTLVVQNVGGAYMAKERIDDSSDTALVELVAWNDFFPLLLTRALLPKLRTTAQHGPVLVQFVGSHAATAAPPTLSVYAATKGFLAVLTRGLDNDERRWGTPSGVEFEYLAVASVATAGNPQNVTMSAPSAEQFGRALVNKAGCGKRYYTPWMAHAIMVWAVGLLPEGVVDGFVAQMMRKQHEERQKKA
ncbi:NAD-P-binding protein [Fomitopsis serialis]|uniref:NAD-P-binding protein n=1 Tax=Fomitopsis serialis TaxID=139415 RepID=UPI0020088C89|nr:NAD-P-binding protein [Neoantrodia serialis]KAH9927259.1 NAD-P-binding protein [Neoantrodia serialis]